MRLGIVVSAVLLAAMSFAAPTAAQTAQPPAAAPAMVFDADFPDPTFVREGSVWYGFATNGPRGNVQVIRSGDLKTWTYLRDALPDLPKWAEGGQTWAPAVAKSPTGWVLFFSARHRTTGYHCIGRATAARVEGPYTDPSEQPFVCQMDRRGSIDPSVFVGADATPYLLYKSEGIEGREPTRIWSHRLNPAMNATVGEPVQLAVTDQPWEEPIIEGPTMIAAGGWHCLLYAASHWESAAYAIGVARCSSPVGPCTKWPHPLLASGATFAGPGSPDVVVGLDGTMLLTFHAWDPARVGYRIGGRRSVRTLPLRVEGGRLIPGDAPAPTATGYRFVATDGGIFSFGASTFHGSTGGMTLNQPIVAMASTPGGGGYWLTASDGGIFAFGDSPFLGSQGARPLNRPIVSMASTPGGGGYWLAASDGGIFTHGDARFLGSTGSMRLNRPIVSMATTPSGRGYWLVASDGGIFTFGDARFHGSTGSIALNSPIVSIVPTPWGDGYWLVAADGGVFAFGAATFLGSTGHLRLNAPIVDARATPSGAGYWFVAADGGIHAFGDAPYFGSTGDRRLNAPIVGMAS
ncbi:MAG TPA: glycoside hydrolase family 43 protein [Acidimicrobiales bacterium]|jgi:hypothetical protein|nr:glycoside hydrolase family 43 protein [Acidimicrobiales bacterium]